MPLIKTITVENGLTLSYHKLRKIESSADMTVITVHLCSWLDADHYATGVGAVWNSTVDMPLSSDVLAEVMESLLLDPTYVGAVETVDTLTSLESYKERQWAVLKSQRDALEFSPVTFDSQVYDADVDSQRRIAGAVVGTIMQQVLWLKYELVQVASQAGVTLTPPPAEPINWTLANSEVVSLTPDQIFGLGAAVIENAKAAHEIGREVYEQIEEATTPEEVTSVVWPPT